MSIRRMYLRRVKLEEPDANGIIPLLLEAGETICAVQQRGENHLDFIIIWTALSFERHKKEQKEKERWERQQRQGTAPVSGRVKV